MQLGDGCICPCPCSPMGLMTFQYHGPGKEIIAWNHKPPSALGTNSLEWITHYPGVQVWSWMLPNSFKGLNPSIITTHELCISYIYKNTDNIDDKIIFQKLFYCHFCFLSFPFSLFLSLILALGVGKMPIILIVSHPHPVLLGCWVQERRYTISTQNGNNIFFS